MSYQRTTWVNGETPVNADNMNNIEDGVEAALAGNLTLNQIYPVGSIYMSVVNVNPSSLFGGTWEAISGKFLIGADSTYTAGSTGGSADAVVPAHTHGVYINTGNAGGHAHNYTYANRSSFEESGSGTKHYSLSSYSTAATVAVGDHYHLVNGNTNSTGVSGTGKNMPPYLSVYIWKRTA